MLPKAYVRHQIENRVRLDLPEERSNHLLFLEIERKLSPYEGVLEVRANPLTGSVLVVHEGVLGEVMEHAKSEGLFEIDLLSSPHRKWQEDLLDKLSRVDKQIQVATQGDLNLGSLAALGLLSAGFFQISRRHFLPAASTLITDAMRILIQVNRSRGGAEGE